MKKITVTVHTVLLVCATANAQTYQASSGDLKNAESTANHAHTGSQMIHLDPETGQLSPKAPKAAKSVQTDDESISIDSEPMNFVKMPDGSTKIELNGRFQKTLNAVVDENGQMQTGHHLHVDPVNEDEAGK